MFRIQDIITIATVLANDKEIPLTRESTGKFTVTMEMLVSPTSPPKTRQEDDSSSDDDDDELIPGNHDNDNDDVITDHDVSYELQILKVCSS